MCKIGNIVTTEQFDDYPLFNIVNNINDIIPQIPTLIIGWEKAKEIFPNACILIWGINEQFYWTFSKRKRRNRYEADIINFKSITIDNIIKKIDYKFMDILTMSVDDKKLFMKLLNDDTQKICVLKDNMVFILNNDNIVYGISLSDIDYKGDDRKKFLKQLYRNKNIKMVDKINLPYEIMQKIKNNMHILPYLFK